MYLNSMDVEPHHAYELHCIRHISVHVLYVLAKMWFNLTLFLTASYFVLALVHMLVSFFCYSLSEIITQNVNKASNLIRQCYLLNLIEK